MLDNNKELHISVGGSRTAVFWEQVNITWAELVEKLKTPVRGEESIETYLKLPKAQQDEKKDVGGFVGGTLTGGRRKAGNVEGRDIITLDLDNIAAGETVNTLKKIAGLGCASAVYSTRKHTQYAPRLRVLIPTDRTVSPDEYEPIARKLAFLIGIEMCDGTTFQSHRLMYWPSCSNNSDYVTEVFDRPFCSADGILAMYEDWRDVSQWPQLPGVGAQEQKRLAKQEDPTKKRGVIGAFCRTYSVLEAMDHFLPGVYEPTAVPGRYTYVGGSTTGGAIVYEGDLFLYSHHATDPCSGLLVNAFDLVRLHLFGDKDEDSKPGTPNNRLPSFKAMEQLAFEDAPVKSRINKERYDQMLSAFGEQCGVAHEPQEDVNLDWMNLLTGDGNGYDKTINNVLTIMENDPALKGKIAMDEFSSCGVVLGSLPWNADDRKRRWSEADDAQLYNYIEHGYGINGRERIENALIIISDKNRINDVEKYLKSLSWDGVKRLDTLLIDYLGAADTPYTRFVIRKALVAAAARGIKGGVKFDYMPIFTGPQGIGKSTFLSILGKDWFSDSLASFEGKEAAELIQGTWINEIGELTALNRQETNAVKQFLSKTHDIYRAAYGRRTEKYPRRCVFFGTSNNPEFLKDATGNRRFWPVDVGIYKAKKSVWEDLPQEADQIWAEAYALYLCGERIYPTPEEETMAKEQQEAHVEEHGKEGVVREFLEKKVPANWVKMNLQQRRMFLNGQLKKDMELVERDRICAVEIWVECFGGDIKHMKRTDSMEINNILARMPGWEKENKRARFGFYGTQRGYLKDKN